MASLFDKLKLPVIKKTKSGYSTDVEVLEKLKKYGYENKFKDIDNGAGGCSSSFLRQSGK